MKVLHLQERFIMLRSVLLQTYEDKEKLRNSIYPPTKMYAAFSTFARSFTALFSFFYSQYQCQRHNTMVSFLLNTFLFGQFSIELTGNMCKRFTLFSLVRFSFLYFYFLNILSFFFATFIKIILGFNFMIVRY